VKKDFNEFMPATNIWFLRFGFALQAYVYHSNIGLFHLSFVILSFFFSRKFTYFMSIGIMLPIYIVEFIVIYGMGIPNFGDKEFFAKANQLSPVTRETMEKHGSPVLE
jgi:hypothetical protein